MKARTFNIMQYEQYLDEQKIKDALLHRSIKRWAYAYHDKDKYTDSDYLKWQEKAEKIEAMNKKLTAENQIKNWAKEKLDEVEAGTIVINRSPKGKHWHIVLSCEPAQDVSTIARWFGIEQHYVDVPKGAGAFVDCVEYLTHESDKEQAMGKYRYADECVQSNFMWRDEVDKKKQRRLKYGKDLNDKDALRNQVLHEGLTLKQVAEKYPAFYTDDMTYLKKCRLEYISKQAPMPKSRINYYVTGKPGYGKGLVSRALARSLIDRNGTMSDDEIFFIVGSKQTTFEGYDGQPVIIWDDCRAFTLLEKLGGRENVFNVFDLFPVDVKQNIKYGSVRLINTINIVNSVQSWGDFLDGLCGEYKDKNGNKRAVEDKTQSYRRFPFFIVVHEKDFELGMNKGIFYGDGNFTEFERLTGIKGNMQQIADRCGDNIELRDKINRQALASVSSKYDEVHEKLDHPQRGTDEEILAEFVDVGTVEDKAEKKRKQEQRKAEKERQKEEQEYVNWIMARLDDDITVEVPFPLED